jgi:hypothetical protein
MIAFDASTLYHFAVTSAVIGGSTTSVDDTFTTLSHYRSDRRRGWGGGGRRNLFSHPNALVHADIYTCAFRHHNVPAIINRSSGSIAVGT